MGRKFVVGGNWKMNGDKNQINEIINNLKKGPLDPNVEVIWRSNVFLGIFFRLICSPYDYESTNFTVMIFELEWNKICVLTFIGILC